MTCSCGVTTILVLWFSRLFLLVTGLIKTAVQTRSLSSFLRLLSSDWALTMEDSEKRADPVLPRLPIPPLEGKMHSYHGGSFLNTDVFVPF
jgi:hypothetical protein